MLKKIFTILMLFLLLILDGKEIKYSKEELLKLIPHVLVGERIKNFDIIESYCQMLCFVIKPHA
jgi:hypothetical protein